MGKLGFCVAVVLACLPQFASADAMHCQMAVKAADDGFIADDIVVLREGNANEVLVLDGLINNYNQGQPVQGKVIEDSKSKLVVSWNLKVHVSGSSASIRYRLSMKKSDNKATVTAAALGFVNQYSTTGVCQKVK